MPTYKGPPDQVRNTTIGVAVLATAAIATLIPLAPTFHPGLIGMVAMIAAGIATARWMPPDVLDLEADHVAQLDRWCERIGIDTPAILRHEYTATGETYWLRVTGHDEHGYVMTPEQFHAYWPKFRAVAGDNCRGVFISPPDHIHGGRCAMTVVWGETETDHNPWPVPVLISASHVRMCWTHDELAAAHAEAERNGYVDPAPTWPAPNPTDRAGEW